MENDDHHPKILLGCTGSVAACRVPEIVKRLKKKLNATVRIIPTKGAVHFLHSNQFDKEDFDTCGAEVFTDADEWKWRGFGDPILHIDLKKWADLILLAPLDANTLAKIANGLADNLLTCVLRAWDVGQKPVVFALAMNSSMIRHPLTAEQVAKLNSFGYVEVPTVEKMLACGDVGPGGIADTEVIVSFVESALRQNKPVVNESNLM